MVDSVRLTRPGLLWEATRKLLSPSSVHPRTDGRRGPPIAPLLSPPQATKGQTKRTSLMHQRDACPDSDTGEKTNRNETYSKTFLLQTFQSQNPISRKRETNSENEKLKTYEKTFAFKIKKNTRFTPRPSLDLKNERDLQNHPT